MHIFYISGKFKYQRSISYSQQSTDAVSNALASRRHIRLPRHSENEGSSPRAGNPRPQINPETGIIPEEKNTFPVSTASPTGDEPTVSPNANLPIPGPHGAKRRVSIKHGKGESMMSFWAQGEKAMTDAQRDKKKADDLQRQLDLTLEMLREEREKNLKSEQKYQALAGSVHNHTADHKFRLKSDEEENDEP